MSVAHGLHVGRWNTGVPSGTVLTNAGALVVTANDQLYEDKIFTAVTITTGLRAIFRRCYIAYTGGSFAVNAHDQTGTTLADAAVFEDCTISGGQLAQSTVYGRALILRRCDVSDGTDLIKSEGAFVAEESWLHVPKRIPGGHHDIVQIVRGDGHDIKRCHLSAYDAVNDDNLNACLQIGQQILPVSGITWHDNYCDGGNFVFNYNDGASATYGHPTLNSFRRNVIGPHNRFGVKSGSQPYGSDPTYGVAGEAPWDSSNVFLASGSVA